MRHALAIVILAGACLADSTTTNHVSNTVVEKAWKRQAVMATPEGGLVDPSGTIAEAVFFQVADVYLEAILDVLSDMSTGVSNQITRLETALEHAPTNGFSIAMDIPLYYTSGAPKVYIAGETSDGTNDTLYVYFSRDMNRAPHVTARYSGMSSTNDVPGSWLSWAGDNITVNGYRGCKRCRFERPTFAIDAAVRGYPHVRFGLPGVGFDIGNGVLSVGNSVGVTTTNCHFTADGFPGTVFYLENGIFKTSGGGSDE